MSVYGRVNTLDQVLKPQASSQYEDKNFGPNIWSCLRSIKMRAEDKTGIDEAVQLAKIMK